MSWIWRLRVKRTRHLINRMFRWCVSSSCSPVSQATEVVRTVENTLWGSLHVAWSHHLVACGMYAWLGPAGHACRACCSAHFGAFSEGGNPHVPPCEYGSKLSVPSSSFCIAAQQFAKGRMRH